MSLERNLNNPQDIIFLLPPNQLIFQQFVIEYTYVCYIDISDLRSLDVVCHYTFC